MHRPIGVLGAGAVGSILAANFAATGHPVVVVEEGPRFEQLQRDGLRVVGRMAVEARPTALLRSIADLKDHDLRALFICTKTWALRTVLPQLAEVVHGDTLVVSFQNGIGVEDEVATYFPPEQVGRGIVNYAGNVDESGQVVMQWFTPPNYLGPLEDGTTPQLVALAQLLSQSRLETRAIGAHDTKKRAFFKTILNSALNALCASSGITMRQAMSYGHTRNLANMLIREGLSVASAVGYTYGENAREECIKYLDQGGDHLPSMWTDLQQGAPTEIEYINGKIVKIGLMFKNIDVDANLFFTSIIITEEIKTGARKPTEIPEYLTHY